MQTLRMSRLSTRRTPALVLLLAAIVGVAAMWGFYSSEGAAKARERDQRLAEAQGDNGSASNAPAPTLEVESTIVRSVPNTEVIELAGVLAPVRATWVSSEIAGRIIAVPAEEHGPVTEGGLLVEIDASLPRAELIRAEANHLLARSELRRQERLGSRSVASEAELDAARAEERSTFAALLEAETRLGQTRIVAPFDGLVNALDLDPGAYVQPGTLIAEILDLSVLEVTVLVGDRQVSALTAGASASVRIDALGNRRIEGKVVRVGGAPSEGVQRYPVVVALPNRVESLPSGAGDSPRAESSLGADGFPEAPPQVTLSIRPGMLANVRFEVGGAASIRLPTRALVNEFELDYVYTLDEEARARRVRVSTRPVPFRPDQVEITAGLSDGDRVAISAVDQLRSGLQVILR